MTIVEKYGNYEENKFQVNSSEFSTKIMLGVPEIKL